MAKVKSTWLKTVEIAFRVENKSNKLPFSVRGYASSEIAQYLLQERKQFLDETDKTFLESLVNKRQCQCNCGCKNIVDEPLQSCCNYCNDGWCEGQ